MELTLGLIVLREVAKRLPASAQNVRDHIDFLLMTGGTLETDAFQMSFSGDPDELGQWRGYAANGMGCSVVTDTIAVKNVADVAGWVIYDPKKQRAFAYKVLNRLRNETDNDKIQQALAAAASYVKHEGFQQELEFRILKFPDPVMVEFRESGDRLVPFVDFLKGKTPLPIAKIIIGPGWQLPKQTSDLTINHVVQGIYRLLTARGIHLFTMIESSRIPYDPN